MQNYTICFNSYAEHEEWNFKGEGDFINNLKEGFLELLEQLEVTEITMEEVVFTYKKLFIDIMDKRGFKYIDSKKVVLALWGKVSKDKFFTSKNKEYEPAFVC